MKVISHTHPFIYVSIALFGVHQLVERVFGIHIKVLDNYLDPLLFMPVFLYLISLERRWLFRNQASANLSVYESAVYFLIVSVTTEIVFPYYSSAFTADLADVVLYGVGTALYLTIIHKRERGNGTITKQKHHELN